MNDTILAPVTSSVELRQLSKIFESDNKKEGNIAVDNLDLKINSGELVTLLGPSGCGKTTTLRMLAGFEFPTSGSIMIGDEDISTTSPNKRDIGMVFQSYALFPHLSVYENIAYGLSVKKIVKEDKKERVKKIADIMQLEELLKRYPSQLSGGQQQRVALARAVVTEPKVLLFDEPLSNLDAKLREYMREELRKIQQKLGITSLYVTHDQTEAMAISDKVVIMKDGRLQQGDTPHNIYINPKNHFVADFMGKANFVTATIKEFETDYVKINLLGEEVIVSNNVDFPISLEQEVDCVIRPEFWKVDTNGNIKGNISNVTYFGNCIEYRVNIKGEQITMLDYEHIKNGKKKEGDEIQLSLSKELISILEKKTTESE